MTTALAALVGVTAAIVGLRVAERTLRRPPHVRQNFRGNPILGTGGVALIAALILTASVALIDADGRRIAATMAAAGLAMGALGYVDDVYGDRHAGGLLGHAKALLAGTFTTGMLKAIGGVVVGLAAAWALGWRGPWTVVAGAVIALGSNLANLLDLRPGRVIKVWVPLATWLAIALRSEAPRALLAGMVAAAVVFLLAELRERVMLGDTGAGLLGVLTGVGAAALFGRAGLVATLAVLVVLTLASEVVSFSRVIDAVPPLRWFDRLGRRP